MTDLVGCALLAGMVSTVMLCLRLRASLGADEGYLWYGVKQLLRRRVPSTGFRAYEPGRYLWSAAIMAVCGRGLFGLRLATHLFFAVSLCIGLLALRQLGIGWLAVAASALALTAMAHPQHKLFEHGIALLAWASYSQLLLRPEAGELMLAAATLGVAQLFGFNLLVYCGAALLMVLAAMLLEGRIAIDAPTIAALMAGGALGLVPYGLMCLFPGFARTFWRRRIVTVFARGGETNIALPRPWPWTGIPRQLSTLGRPHARAFQWVFLGLLMAPAMVLVAFMLGWSPELHAGLLAAAALSLGFSHHAMSRADPAHITQSVAPLCLLALLLAAGLAPVATVGVAVATAWLIWPLQPSAQRRARPAAFGRLDAGGLSIDVPLPQLRTFGAVQALCHARGIGDGELFAAPAYPALYAILDRQSPVYDTFPLLLTEDNGQERMIAEMEGAGVQVAIVSDAALVDRRDDLRFSRTHPKVWSHLQSRFIGTLREDLGPGVHIFERR